jgi:UDP-glucose 4-epimerase
VPLNQVVALLTKISGTRMVAKHDAARDGDIRDSQADITQARNFLGYEPKVDFEEGLRRTFEWYKTTAQAKAAAAQAQAPAPTTASAPTK